MSRKGNWADLVGASKKEFDSLMSDLVNVAYLDLADFHENVMHVGEGQQKGLADAVAALDEQVRTASSFHTYRAIESVLMETLLSAIPDPKQLSSRSSLAERGSDIHR